MHLRISTIKRNGHTYRYGQLVTTERRAGDGMPVHKVLGHLGALSDLEIANWRVALEASRQGVKAVVGREPSREPVAVAANLAYLDVAVALELWRALGLDGLVGALLDTEEQEAAASDVVAALVVQRCVAPGSKLFAQRWYPRTALPELLGVAPSAFNNTRIHRVLDQLDVHGQALQEALGLQCAREQGGTFSALFMDTTDTWFVGQGPALSRPGKTKEGRWQNKIGIVLMCNEAGLPLRWQVIGGRTADSTAMSQMVRQVQGVSWVGQTPIVCDRAMGKSAQIRDLLACDVRFLTALCEDEIPAYVPDVPYESLLDEDVLEGERTLARLGALVEQAGMKRARPHTYLSDLGVVMRADRLEPATGATVVGSGGDALERAVGQARQMRAALDQGLAASWGEAGRPLGLRKERAAKLGRLLELAPDVLAEIEAGRAQAVSISAMLQAAVLGNWQLQREAFEAARRAPTGKMPRSRRPNAARRDEPVSVRAVLCFNAEQFVTQRIDARDKLSRINAFVDHLNVNLVAPRARLDARAAHSEVRAELRRLDLLDVFNIEVIDTQRGERVRPQVRVELLPHAWRRRRRYDGFSVLIGHPDLTLSAEELDRLYRAKDAIEKDFHVIKSVVQLRPVRHHTDPKVRSHVSLCMLALMLERTLATRLASTPVAISADMAFELLQPIHLNKLVADQPVYTVTHADTDQRAILSALGLTSLLDDTLLAERITPR
jgi:hypothetical protein